MDDEDGTAVVAVAAARPITIGGVSVEMIWAIIWV
jgi:hypothetical protein